MRESEERKIIASDQNIDNVKAATVLRFIELVSRVVRMGKSTNLMGDCLLMKQMSSSTYNPLVIQMGAHDSLFAY